MNNLNKANFFDEMMERYPQAMDFFCKWVDEYKAKNKWVELFNTNDDGLNLSQAHRLNDTKFHDLPYELQYGAMLAFFHHTGKLQFLDVTSSRKFFEDMFQCVENGSSYYAEGEFSPGVSMIQLERRQQIFKHEFDVDNDKANNEGELVKVAAAILLKDNAHYPSWWDIKFIEKMAGKSEKEKLVIAGALIAAELDRLTEDEKLKDAGDTK